MANLEKFHPRNRHLRAVVWRCLALFCSGIISLFFMVLSPG